MSNSPIQAIHLGLPKWISGAIDTNARYVDADAQIALAIELSRLNVENGSGGPFGAAVFVDDGELVAVGVNRVVPEGCSVAHAEMMAFMGAQKRLGRPRLNDDGRRYTLATSAQPCCQCYGASVWAGIDNLLIGARAEDVMRLTEFDEGPLPADWVGELARRNIQVRRDIQRELACQVLEDYEQLGGARY